MKAAEILRKAAGLIRIGWTRGTFFEKKDGVACYCALGAINEVAYGDVGGGDDRSYPEISLAKQAMRKHVPNGYITDWNDAIAKDGEEVAAAMERAAASLEPAP